jgi:ankyrin repeat protein
VDCQVVHICDCIPARIRQALAELPETLDETYERTLRGINKANWEFAHRMFQFVSVASRPLHVKELADLLAFDFKAGSIPEFHKEWRLEDPANAILSTCSTLLAIVNGQGSPVVQFSHFSVKEFLTSIRLAKATDIVFRRYHVSMTPAHTLVAQACLGILLHLDKDVTRDSLEDFPLAEYAAKHWADHARFEDVSRNVEDGMKQLFDPSKPHLAICVWIYDPAFPTWKRMTRNETPLSLPQTSLHYAASWGLHHVVEYLITEHSQDVCSRDSTDNATPLHLASLNGHVNAARKLIERGADTTAQDNYGETPLYMALGGGQVDVARMLIEHGADLSAQNNYGWTPLHRALDRRQVDVARMLIERGADLTAQNNYGQTPLHIASGWGRVDVALMLIECGADVTAQNNNRQTPLHIASDWGHVDVARMLIERGADLTAQNDGGETPLHLASQMGQVDVARMLIERGADLTAQNNDQETPLHLMSASSSWAGISPQKYAEVAHMLLEHGADVNARNKNGLTPFLLASQGGLAEIIHVLVQHGANSGAYNDVN